MRTYRVLLVEDDEPTRGRLARAVDTHAQLQVSAAVGTCAAARQAIAAAVPDVSLVDLGLPDGSGVDLIREIHAACPESEIMVVTVFADEAHVVAALEAGASGYLLKDGSAEYIADSIMQMLAGGSPISTSIARYLLRRFRDTPDAAPDGKRGENDAPRLTARESDVLELVAKGFSYSEIGAALGMSVHTVTSHIKHIYRKLAVRSRGEAVFEASQLGLIKLRQ